MGRTQYHSGPHVHCLILLLLADSCSVPKHRSARRGNRIQKTQRHQRFVFSALMQLDQYEQRSKELIGDRGTPGREGRAWEEVLSRVSK